MRDEPEMGIRFQYEMSLRSRAGKGGILLVNDHQHAEPGTAEPGRDGRIRPGQSGIEDSGRGSASDLQFRREAATSARFTAAEPEPAWHRAGLLAEGDRVESGTSQPVDPAVDEDASGAAQTATAPPLS